MTMIHQANNEFEEVCGLASEEGWCWKLGCTTCGNLHFRYSFSELAAGKSPSKPKWIIHHKRTHYRGTLGPLPKNYLEDQKAILCKICCDADIKKVASTCRFPDWLGYLGLAIWHLRSDSEHYQKLSSGWAAQLVELVTENSNLRSKLSEIAQGEGVLNLKDLEECETDLKVSRWRIMERLF